MRHVQIADKAGTQFNRISRAQLRELGVSPAAIGRLIASGRLVIREQGVFAIPPVMEDDWGKWQEATLTAPHTFLSGVSAAAANGFWSRRRHLETVTRPGNGGPTRHGDVLVFHSETLDGDTELLRGIPITSVPRTLLDLARHVSARQLARCFREAIRLTDCTIEDVADCIGQHRGARGSRRLAEVLARYSGLPLERARSGAEVRAMELLRDAGHEIPDLNRKVAGEEADLKWTTWRLIIEIDGGPFHQDAGEDARKEAAWQAAGWTVRRLSSDDIYEHPDRLLALAVPPNVSAGTAKRSREPRSAPPEG